MLPPQLEIFEGVGACLFSAGVTRECMRLCFLFVFSSIRLFKGVPAERGGGGTRT